MRLRLIGPGVKKRKRLELLGGWLQVASHPATTYEAFLAASLASGAWQDPTMLLAENAGLFDAVWTDEGAAGVAQARNGGDGSGATTFVIHDHEGGEPTVVGGHSSASGIMTSSGDGSGGGCEDHLGNLVSPDLVAQGRGPSACSWQPAFSALWALAANATHAATTDTAASQANAEERKLPLAPFPVVLTAPSHNAQVGVGRALFRRVDLATLR